MCFVGESAGPPTPTASRGGVVRFALSHRRTLRLKRKMLPPELRRRRAGASVGVGGSDRILSPFSKHRQQVAAHQAADAGLGSGARCSADGAGKSPCGFAMLGSRRAWAAARFCPLALSRNAGLCGGCWSRQRGRRQRQLAHATRRNAHRALDLVIPLADCLSHAFIPCSRPSHCAQCTNTVCFYKPGIYARIASRCRPQEGPRSKGMRL